MRWMSLLGAVLLTAACHDARLFAPRVSSPAWVEANSCRKQARRARWPWSAYRALLAELADPRYLVVPLHEYARLATAPVPDKVLVGMRHDLDGNICHAERMAELDAAAGVHATYFLRTTDPYFAWGWPAVHRRPDEVARYRHMAALGHEIGIHVDALSMAVDWGLDPLLLLRDDLAWLRARGLVITGAAAHGSPEAHRAGFNNYELFAGMTTRASLAWQGRHIPLGRASLADFGLAYEAYHVPNDLYLSEAGGAWKVPDPIAALRAAKPGQRVQILTHPVWWGKPE
jgi:hypothetical protein